MLDDTQVVAIMAAIIRTSDLRAQEMGNDYAIVERPEHYVKAARELLSVAQRPEPCESCNGTGDNVADFGPAPGRCRTCGGSGRAETIRPDSRRVGASVARD